MKINEISQEIHTNALAKGFWDENKNVINKMTESGLFTETEIKATRSAFLSQKLLLAVSELTEAMEADRIDKRSDIEFFDKRLKEIMNSTRETTPENDAKVYSDLYKIHIKDSLEAEIAGTIIRCLDFCKEQNIDIEKHIQAEHNFNLTRPIKHGKKY